MKLYDYTSLLKIVDEIDLEKTKLLNIQEMQLKNKCADLEFKLLNSGILEDWVQLLDLAKKCDCGGGLSYWDNKYLNDNYEKYGKRISYEGRGDISRTADWCGDVHYGLLVRKSVNSGKIEWGTIYNYSLGTWKGFDSPKREFETKIMIIEALFNTYEEYRNYNLTKLIPIIERKASENQALKDSISTYK